MMSFCKKKRIIWLDTAKGIGILCVIAGHIGLSFVDSFLYSFNLPLFFL